MLSPFSNSMEFSFAVMTAYPKRCRRFVRNPLPSKTPVISQTCPSASSSSFADTGSRRIPQSSAFHDGPPQKLHDASHCFQKASRRAAPGIRRPDTVRRCLPAAFYLPSAKIPQAQSLLPQRSFVFFIIKTKRCVLCNADSKAPFIRGRKLWKIRTIRAF